MNEEASDRIDIGALLGVIRRRLVWILLPTLAIGLLAGYWSTTRAPEYSSTASVLLRGSAAQEALDGGSQNTGFLNREMMNEVSFARSDPVTTIVVEELGYFPNVSVSSEEGSDLLFFSATSGDPDDAANEANAWANAYIQAKRQGAIESITSASDSFRTRLAQLEAERNELTPDEAASLEGQLLDAEIQVLSQSIIELQLNSELAGTGTARVLQAASPPFNPTSTQSSVIVVAGVMFGMAVGLGLAFFRESLDSTIKTEDDAIRAVGLPVLAAIPKPARRESLGELGSVLARHPDSSVAGAYRVLRSALEFRLMDEHVESLLITSPNAGDGKSTTATNLGWAVAASGSSSIVVDLDFRRPRVHEIFGVPLSPGVSELVADSMSLGSATNDILHPSMNLQALTAGTPPRTPGEFISTPKFAAALGTIRDSAELAIFDSGPVLTVADTLSVAPLADAALLVVKSGSTTVAELRTAVAKLRGAGSRVIGVVLTSAPVDFGSGYTSNPRGRSQASLGPGRRALAEENLLSGAG